MDVNHPILPHLTSNPRNRKVAGHRNMTSVLLPSCDVPPQIAEPSGHPMWRDSLEARAYGAYCRREVRELCHVLSCSAG